MNLKFAASIALVVLSLPLRADAARWPGFAHAQKPHPAVARVVAPERDGMSLGSGTLVDANDGYGLVVTNWHVVRDAVGPVEVIFPDGFRSPGRVVRMDREWDLAAVLIWKPSVQPVLLSGQPPKPGQWLTIAGYGSGNYKAQSGPCTQYLAPGVNRPFEIVEVKAAARQGDSGGPIFNERGELAGVLFGEGGGKTSGSYSGRVQKFLERTALDLRHLQPISTRTEAIAGKANANANPSFARLDGQVRSLPESEIATASAVNQSAEAWPEAISPRVAAQNVAVRDEMPPLSMTDPHQARGSSTLPLAPANPRNLVWSDELKSFLAAFGLAAIVLQVLRITGGVRI